MTELQFLIKILTTQKLSATLKDLLIERIGEVEATFSRPAPIIRQPSTVQAPSMQRIIDETPVIQNTLPIPKPVAIDKETGRAMVNTGRGTMGPRKF